jgi:amidohydrolase ring-opening protein AtzD/TrzD
LRRSRDIKPSRVAGKPASIVPTPSAPHGGPAAIGLIEGGALDPAHIATILVKTEGNGGVNNFTREYTCATTPSSPRSSARSPWWCLAAARMRYITVKCGFVLPRVLMNSNLRDVRRQRTIQTS